MRTTHFTLTSAHVQQLTFQHLQPYLQLTDHGPKCTAPLLLSLVLWAAARITSLAAACAALTKAPSDQAARTALLATLPDFHELQRRLNQALRGGLPKALRRKEQRVAIDLILLPYYGQPEDDPAEIYRGARKAGTRTFHAYATAYVIRKGCRWTLALRAVHHADPWDEIVKDLLRQVRQAGVQIGLVLLDRGFYCVDVIRYLQAARTPFVMPVIRRGRQPKHPAGPSGTWAFTTWKRSGWATYTLQEKRAKRRATVSIAVSCRWVEDRKGKRKRQVWVYAYWGLQPSRVDWVRETYRLRFGIESSYRQLAQARVRTSTRSPLLRLLYVGVALLLRNVWVWLHWEVLAERRRGYRRVDLGQLRFREMLRWLQGWVEAWLGVRDAIHTERPLPQWLVSVECQ